MDTDSTSVCSSVSTNKEDLTPGTLDEIIQSIIELELNEETYDKINIILLSFHLYSSVYCFLTIIDAKFWHLCFDTTIWPNDKFNLLRSLIKILERWLSDPFVESFYCPPDFLDLKRLFFLVSQWLRVFTRDFQSARRKNSKSKEAARCQLIMKARDSVNFISQPCRLDLVKTMEDVCSKITTISDRFHITAGLFKELNCDKDPLNVTTDLSVQPTIINGVLNKFSPRHIAEQLTLYDAELFIKVIPSECLDYVRHRLAKSVDATIKQFNRIYGLVLTTIIEADHMAPIPFNDASGASLASLALSVISIPLQQDRQKHVDFDERRSALPRLTSSLSSSQDLDSLPCADSFLRARVLAKWISVAAELRDLRSFSAFTSVMTALQGSAISGLHTTWGIIERYYSDNNETFRELSELLKLDDNRKYARELLDHVYSSYELARHHESRHSGLLSTLFRRKIGSDCSVHEVNILKTVGTIPYLGIFLNDLAMLNESAPDRVPRLKSPELRRPTSGTGIVNVAENSKKTSNGNDKNHVNEKHNSHVKKTSGFQEKRQKSHQSHESLVTQPALMPTIPRQPSRLKRMNERMGSGNGNVVQEPSSGKPPVPMVVDHRSRKEVVANASGSSTTPTSGDVVLPKDKRSRQAKGPHGPPLLVEPLSANITSPPVTHFQRVPRRTRTHSLSFPMATKIAASAKILDNDNLINFRKHSREYKILSKLMQLQDTAKRYKIPNDTSFRQWFENLVLLSEQEASQKAKSLESTTRKASFRYGVRRISGSMEVLCPGTGSNEVPHSQLSSPTRLAPCHSAAGSKCYGRSSFNEHYLRRTPFRESPKRDTPVLKRYSVSLTELHRPPEQSPLSRAQQQLATFKNKIKITLSRPRHWSSYSPDIPVTLEDERSTRF